MAIRTKHGAEAELGRSQARHAVVLVVYSKIAGITCAASPCTTLPL